MVPKAKVDFTNFVNEAIVNLKKETGQWTQESNFNHSFFWFAFDGVLESARAYLSDEIGNENNAKIAINKAFDQARQKYDASYDDHNTPNDWVACITMSMAEGLGDLRNSIAIQKALIDIAVIATAAKEYAQKKGDITDSDGKVHLRQLK